MVGKARSRELCEALELARCTLQADHFRFLSTNHSRPIAATISTTMILHGVDEAGPSLAVAVAGLDKGASFDFGGSTGDALPGWGACEASFTLPTVLMC